MGQSPVQTVSASSIQIRAHHHIDVCTDINNITPRNLITLSSKVTLHVNVIYLEVDQINSLKCKCGQAVSLMGHWTEEPRRAYCPGF